MAWRGSVSRSLMSSARSASFRQSPSIYGSCRLRPPTLSVPRRLSFSNPRTLRELGCAQSLISFHRVGSQLTSHLSANVRACCELSHGTFCRSCQDR